MALDFGDFSLDRALLEVRYDFAFPMWDRSGLVGDALRSTFGPLELREANPSKIQAEVRESLMCTVENEKSVITEHNPEGRFEDFRVISADFVDIVRDIFEIDTYVRAGARLFYMNHFDDKRTASNEISESNVIEVPNTEGPNFDVSGPINEVNYSYRYEGEGKGVSVSMKTVSKELSAKPPIQVRHWEGLNNAEMNAQRVGLQLDIDRYTTSPTNSDSFGADRWLEDTRRFIRRDISPFLHT